MTPTSSLGLWSSPTYKAQRDVPLIRVGFSTFDSNSELAIQFKGKRFDILNNTVELDIESPLKKLAKSVEKEYLPRCLKRALLRRDGIL